MDPQRYDALVTRLEAYAAASPDAYRRRVLLLALLGYAYLLVVLALILAAVGLLVWLLFTVQTGLGYIFAKLGFPLLILAWVVVRSMWVKFSPPGGRALTREEAPRLFAVVESLRKASGAPHFHAVHAAP